MNENKYEQSSNFAKTVKTFFGPNGKYYRIEGMFGTLEVRLSISDGDRTKTSLKYSCELGADNVPDKGKLDQQSYSPSIGKTAAGFSFVGACERDEFFEMLKIFLNDYERLKNF